MRLKSKLKHFAELMAITLAVEYAEASSEHDISYIPIASIMYQLVYSLMDMAGEELDTDTIHDIVEYGVDYFYDELEYHMSLKNKTGVTNADE